MWEIVTSTNEDTTKSSEQLPAWSAALVSWTAVSVQEIIDILDKDHYISTWEIKAIWTTPKKKAHENWDFHQAAHIWIYNDKWEVLIQKRAENKFPFPWKWDVSWAGHIWTWETSEEWALRELEEELWMTIKKGTLQKMFEFPVDISMEKWWKTMRNDEVNHIFALKTDLPLESFRLQMEEVADVRYIDIKELEKEVNDPELSKKYVPVEGYFPKVVAELKKILSVNQID